MSSHILPRQALPPPFPKAGAAFELAARLRLWFGHALDRWLALGGGRSPALVPERLVLFLPALLLPAVGTAGDFSLLALLCLCVVTADMALAAGGQRALAVATAAWLGAGLLLGIGTAVTFALWFLVRGLEGQRTGWPALALAALGAALLVDLAMVGLALERSGLWLALGAMAGLAGAAKRGLAETSAESAGRRSSGHDLAAHERVARERGGLETLFVTALVLGLALYGALLAHDAALRPLAAAGGYLTVPLLALAILRLAMSALARPQSRPERHPERRWRDGAEDEAAVEPAAKAATPVDPLTLAAFAAWALAASLLFEI